MIPQREPAATIRTPIYRDVAMTLNKTCIDVYVTEKYTPVVHYVYLEKPWVTPINAASDFEVDNWCKSRLPIINLIEMLVTNQQFAFVNSSDVGKVAGFIQCYIKQFEGINLDKDPQQKAFLENCKLAYTKFHDRFILRKIQFEKPKEKKLSLVDRLAMLRLQC